MTFSYAGGTALQYIAHVRACIIDTSACEVSLWLPVYGVTVDGCIRNFCRRRTWDRRETMEGALEFTARTLRSAASGDDHPDEENCSSNASSHGSHQGHSSPGTVLFLFAAFAVGGERMHDNVLLISGYIHYCMLENTIIFVYH